MFSLSLLIGVLITVVIGAILFWVIDRFCPEARLAQLLKLLVVLVCLGSIISRIYPLFEILFCAVTDTRKLVVATP